MTDDKAGVFLDRLERVAAVTFTAVILWQILPQSVKQAAKAKLAVLPREVRRYRRVRHERRMLESEAWHVGQIINEYGRVGHGTKWLTGALGISGDLPDVGGRSEGLGET